MRDDPERGLFCINLDKDEQNLIFGEFLDDKYKSLGINMTPCNYLHTDGNYTGDSIHPECVPDLDK